MVKHPRESTLDPILVLTLFLLSGQTAPELLFVHKTARSEEKRVLTISSILFEKNLLKPAASSKTLSDLGKSGIIQFIRDKGPPRLPSHVRKGIGNDCAILKAGANTSLLVTTDTLIDGIAKDLRHICEQSRIGATLDGTSIPI